MSDTERNQELPTNEVPPRDVAPDQDPSDTTHTSPAADAEKPAEPQIAKNVAVDIDGVVLDPTTFPKEASSLLSIAPEYILAYKDKGSDKDTGGRRSLTFNGQNTRYKPLKFEFEGLRVLSDGIQQKKDYNTGELKDQYQIALTFPDDYESESSESHGTYAILKAIDDFIPNELLKHGTLNGSRVKTLDVAKTKYGTCLRFKKQYVTLDGKEIPESEVDEWAEDDMKPKYPPNIYLDVRQAMEKVASDNPKSKEWKQKTPSFKPAIIDPEGRVQPVNIYNYGGLIPQNTIVDGIAQIDYVQSTKGEIGRTTIGLSLVQLEMRKSKQYDNSASSAPSDVPQVFKMRRNRQDDSDVKDENKKAKRNRQDDESDVTDENKKAKVEIQ